MKDLFSIDLGRKRLNINKPFLGSGQLRLVIAVFLSGRNTCRPVNWRLFREAAGSGGLTTGGLMRPHPDH